MNGSAKLPVQISSQNFIENGYPVMTLSLYRRFLQLFKLHQRHAPNRTHLTISNITPAGQYNYYLNLTYKK